MTARSREQQLVDIVFSAAIKAALALHGKPTAEVAAWVADQLKQCGFPTEPMGMSWGVLQSMPMPDTAPEWILVTLLDGYRKPFRPSAIITYGTLPSGSRFIDVGHGALEVRESEAEIASLVGSPYVGGIDTAIQTQSPPPPPPQREVSFRRGS
jgi:hypothetical protein